MASFAPRSHTRDLPWVTHSTAPRCCPLLAGSGRGRRPVSTAWHKANCLPTESCIFFGRYWFFEAIKITDGEYLGGVELPISQTQGMWALQPGSRFFNRWQHHHSNPDTLAPHPAEADHGHAVVPGMPQQTPRDTAAPGKAHSRAVAPASAYACNWPGLIPPGAAPGIAWPKIGSWESLPEIQFQKMQLLTMPLWDRGSLGSPCPQASTV